MTAILKKHHKIVPYLLIVLGTFLLALAIQWIFDPIGLVTGGFSGLAIIIKNISSNYIEGGIPLWLTNIALNIPVFIIAYWKMGRHFVGRTLFGTIMLSVWLYWIPLMDFVQGDFLLAAIFGGFFSGAGIGLVLRANATTGGTDMVAALLHRKLRHHSVAKILFVLDGLVIIIGGYIFGIHATMYAVIAIFVGTKVSDAIVEGFKYSKAAFIITDKYQEVSKKIMVDLVRGLTGFRAKGMYTGDDKFVLYCVVSKKEIVSLKELVVEIDPNAFVIVSDVHEVLGEGFLEYNDYI